jgi:HrpA-like RNA helicase
MYPVKIQYKDYHYIKEPITKIEKVINEEIIPYVDEMKRELEGNILVFCTNVEEINMLVEKYTKKLDSSIFKVLPLHGKLTP